MFGELNEKMIAALKEIAVEAGAAILEIYHNADDIEIEQKSDDSPLTKADRAANTVICDGLAKLPLLFPIVSEENKAIAYEERKDYEYFWLVDPLDGTKEFIKRNGDFTVNIALIHQQKAVLSVVYAPCLDELYWAMEGAGAFRQKNGAVEQLHVAQFSMADKGLKVVASRSHLNEETKAFMEKLKEPDIVSKGSSLKFLMLATGEAHLYPRVAPTMEWDTAAAQMILEEAGGAVLHFDSQKPLLYNKENMLNPFFIALGKAVD